jgi:outer membrane protein OmpA-like peptidoglycan-associated protein
MNVISYGMEKPVASNKTKDGRAQNRRVVIRVLV